MPAKLHELEHFNSIPQLDRAFSDSAGQKEIVRVLKPGWRVLITDIRHAQEYADVFRSLGMTDVNVSAPTFIFVIPSRSVSARKPA